MQQHLTFWSSSKLLKLCIEYLHKKEMCKCTHAHVCICAQRAYHETRNKIK